MKLTSIIAFLSCLATNNAFQRIDLKARSVCVSQAFNHKIGKSLRESSFLHEHFPVYKSRVENDPQASALAFVDSWLEKHSISQEAGFGAVVSDWYESSNGIWHVYLTQTFHDIEIVNANMNLNVDQEGNILSFGESFYRPLSRDLKRIKKVSEDMTAMEAVVAIANYLDIHESHDWSKLHKVPIGDLSKEDKDYFQYEDAEFLKGSPFKKLIIAKRRFLHSADSGLRKVWDVEMDLDNNWIHAQICSKTGKIYVVGDWSAQHSYRVYPLGTPDPLHGQRVLLENPEDKVVSPNGWVTKAEKAKTEGNNVHAQANWDGKDGWKNNHRPTEKLGKFDFELDLSATNPHSYVDAAITNLFYWNNMLHDIMFKYGFDEVSGNFQDKNFEAGKGNDGVIANAQDGSGMNNANFATPPDGRRPRMRMYVWDVTNPKRDGDLESGIIVHEYMHGVSIRLTGGPSNSDCLYYGESAGMGEGWGDIVALVLHHNKDYTRDREYKMGSYVFGGKSIRKYPYSTNMQINPETYSYIKKFDYWNEHAKGEVWAAILWECYWNLIDEYGFDSNVTEGKGGNNIFLQNLLDGMKFQPCRPSFVDARDAIIQADEVNYDGANLCHYWKGFGKRGLGLNAKHGGKEDFTIPEECKTTE